MKGSLRWLAAGAAALAAGAARAEDAPARAVLAGNQFVDPVTGATLGKVPGASAYDAAVPVPGSDGVFRIGDLVVDASMRKVTGRAMEEISFKERAVVRRNAEGEVLWTHELASPPGGVRPPDRVASGGGVYVVEGNAVVALDRGTGEEAWRAEGEHDRLMVSGSLVLATSCGSPADPKHGRCLVARDAKTGADVFRARLPDAGDPEPIREAGELLVVSDVGFARSQPAWTRCFDRTGRLRIELPEPCALVWPAGRDLMMVTPSRTVRLDPEGRTLWETKDFVARDSSGAEVAALPGGDVVLYAWSPISDSGVRAVRLAAADGKVAWKAACEPLGVGHSKYWHRCYLEVRGDALVIVSQGAGGHFVEVLDAAKGTSIRRTLVK